MHVIGAPAAITAAALAPEIGEPAAGETSVVQARKYPGRRGWMPLTATGSADDLTV